MSDLLEFAGGARLSDGWGVIKEFEYLQDIPKTSLEFWWRADKITDANDGDAIETLSNEAGTGDPTQGTLAARAVYRTNQINGMPALDFDGVDDYYIVNGPQSAFTGEDKPFTLYMVYANDVTNTILWHLSLGRVFTTDTSLRFGITAAALHRVVKEDDAGVTAAYSTGTAVTTPILRVELSPGTTYSLWENETSLRSAESFNVGTLTLARFAIGAAFVKNVVTGFFNGKLSEVLMYSASHSATDRLLVSRYLKNKYRLYL